MKPLSKDEVAEIMKKEVPVLLHKRIAELEQALAKAIYEGEMSPYVREELITILMKGFSL